MNQNYKPENHLRPIELHHADISFKKDIKKSCITESQEKKEKIKAPQGTARSILQCASEEPCPVLFEFSSTKSSKDPAGFGSIATILAFAAYAAIRLVNVII